MVTLGPKKQLLQRDDPYTQTEVHTIVFIMVFSNLVVIGRWPGNTETMRRLCCATVLQYYSTTVCMYSIIS